MIKSFKFNKNNKIELTKEQLKSLLDDAYWEGYRSASGGTTWTYTTPNWTPYTWISSMGTITLNSNDSAATSTITGTTI